MTRTRVHSVTPSTANRQPATQSISRHNNSRSADIAGSSSHTQTLNLDISEASCPVQQTLDLASSTSGRPLDVKTKHSMGSRFGHDFSKVKIHTGTRAARLAQALNANAFTKGTDIIFGEGFYNPHSLAGQRLLAHELAHVVHSSEVKTFRPGIAPENSASEVRAQDVANRVARGSSLGVQTFRNWGPAWAIHRQVKKISKRGTVAHTGEVGRAPKEVGVPTGTVEVRTGEEIEMKGGSRIPNLIAIEFTGTNNALAAASRWLQFVWFELVATTPKGLARVAGSIPTTSGTKPFTTNPAAPNWSVDSASTSNPFYEAAGINLRSSSATTIFDAPGGGSVKPLADAVFGAGIGATSVVFTAHFEVYLIQSNNAAYVVGWQASTAFTRSGSKTSVGAIGYTVAGSGQVKTLPTARRKLLHSAYPKYKGIK